MASLAELQDALVNADKAGDVAAARQLADAIHAARSVASAKPLAAQAGGTMRDAVRAPGLTARYLMEGLGQTLDIGAEPIRNLVVNPLLGAVGARKAESSVGQLASKAADLLGLPSPQGANERVIADASRMVAGAGGLAGGVGALAARLPQGVAQGVAQGMAANPGLQAVGAAGSGLAGGSVREAGGGTGEQLVASVLGGVASPLAARALQSGATSAGNSVRAALTPQRVQMERADQQINLTLQRAGVDWSQIPERIKQTMRADVAEAMNTGRPLNADAMRRLLVFRQANVTPTVGQLTQDPGQITREMNLAKAGANSTDPMLQRLPALQNENTAALLRQLDEAGAANAQSQSGTGMAAINSLDTNASATRQGINSLYQAARDTEGRSLPLDGAAFTRRANEMLQQNLAPKLGAEVDNLLNDIASGRTPLTVEYAEQIKTLLGRKSRNAADGDLRFAYGLVRRALDEASPVQAQVNPGNLPAVAGTVPPSAIPAANQSVQAFNAARQANRQWMQRVENNPALAAVVDGVEPDQFVQRFVIGKGATAADVRALHAELDPAAQRTLRDYLVRHLRDAATNNTDDVTKFSNAAYRKALRDLEDKLPIFFNREEIAQLRAYGDAAKYMQAQPAGSAVNNSNSGALLIGKGLDMLQSASQRIPIVRDSITGVIQGMQQRQVMAPRNALAGLLDRPPVPMLQPSVGMLGLLAAPGVNGREDRKRD